MNKQKQESIARVMSLAGGVVGVSSVAKKSGYRRVRSQNDRASRAAASSDGFAFWLPFCPNKRDNPRSTVTGAEVDTDPVYKHRSELSCVHR